MDDVFCFHGLSDGLDMPADGGITESQLHDSSWFFIKFSFWACWAEKSGSPFYVYPLNIYNNETRKKVWIAATAVWCIREKKVTNRRLASLIGISEQQVGKYVNKREDPSLYRLHQIANALGMLVKDLFEPID